MLALAMLASSRICANEASVCCAHSSTRPPSLVNPTKRRPRCTMTMPSSFSRLRMPEDRAGCDTWQASAALAKCFSRARVAKYSSCRMNMPSLASIRILP